MRGGVARRNGVDDERDCASARNEAVGEVDGPGGDAAEVETVGERDEDGARVCGGGHGGEEGFRSRGEWRVIFRQSASKMVDLQV